MKTLAAFVLVSLITAPLPADEPKKDELQGEWKMVEFIREGKNNKDKLGTITFQDGKMTIKNGREESATYTLDPKADPPAIDIKPELAGKDKEITVKGIYKLEKDKLTICFGLDQSERPKEFKSEEGSKTGCFVLERVKK